MGGILREQMLARDHAGARAAGTELTPRFPAALCSRSSAFRRCAEAASGKHRVTIRLRELLLADA